jgi:hypothetical protein
MNRAALGQSLAESGESLARLAEIADVVSRQQHPGPSPHGSAEAAAPMRKRPVEIGILQVKANASSKKIKMDNTSDDDDHGDVRFREYQAEIWSEKFEDLCEFRRFYGHCHVPHYYQRNAPLAQWVKRQRYQYKLKVDGKRSTLSDERVRLLNKIGFIWNSHDVVWEERWNELLLYKRVHGDCIVPSNYDKNPQLAVWVKRQRRQYKFYCGGKSTSMTKERISKLERLGFAWDCRKPRDDSSKINDRIDATGVVESIKSTAEVVALAITGRAPDTTPTAPTMKYPKCEFFTFGKKFGRFGS